MSYQTFFNFSDSLLQDLVVPTGTVKRVRDHICKTAEALQIKPFDEQAWVWDNNTAVNDEVLCAAVEEHNRFVMHFHDQLSAWAEKPMSEGETFTVSESKRLFKFLNTMRVPLERWSEEYFIEQMRVIYEVMRGRSENGITFDAKPLSPEQCDAVLTLFSEFMDKHDVRVAVLKGKDMIGSRYYGEWDWCEKCAASIAVEDRGCAKRGCPVRKEARENGDFE